MKTVKHIIIEGVDKTGKTTLANELSRIFGMPIKKFSAPKDGRAFESYADFLLNEKTPHIIDRCYMSELAYGPVVRGTSQVSPLQKQLLETAIEGSVICLYCYDTEEAIAGRFDTDKEEYTSKGQIARLLKEYDEQLDKSKLNWLMLDLNKVKAEPSYPVGYVYGLLS